MRTYRYLPCLPLINARRRAVRPALALITPLARVAAPLRALSPIGLISFVILCCGCNAAAPKTEQPLVVAAAANLRFALEEITADFTARTGIPTETTLASSGKLTAQITAGAPYDVFLSADEQYPATLAAAGLTLTPPATYAYGPLALWTTTSNIPLDPDSLVVERITKIALPNPATAPYGAAAMAFLRQRQLDSLLTPKLVFGESVGQANQFVFSGAAEVGFTALATVSHLEKTNKYQRLDQVPQVRQTGVILQSSKQQQAALAFLEYLLSAPGQTTLRKFGYFTPE